MMWAAEVAVPTALGTAHGFATQAEAQLCGAFCASKCCAGRAGLPVGTIRQQIAFYREKREGEKLKSSYRKRGEKTYLS